MFVIYGNPKDYPGKFVVRQRWCYTGFDTVAVVPKAVCNTLDEARNSIPIGFVNIGREKEDDPVIHEVWCTAKVAKLLKEKRKHKE